MTAVATPPQPPTTRGRSQAVAAATATFVFGFLGMALYSLTGPAFGPLPTVWQSWGGTVGDVVLPFVVYGLVRGVQILGPRRVHMSSYVAGGAGSLGGASAQVAWLLDPQPYTNWMLVEAHTFSPIGWYHFAYLVTVAGFVTGTAWELLVRARRARLQAGESMEVDHRLRVVLRSRATTATITLIFIFAAAVAADSVTSLESLASVGTSVGALLPPLLALLVAAVMLGPSMRMLLRPLATAMGVVVVIVTVVIAVLMSLAVLS